MTREEQIFEASKKFSEYKYNQTNFENGFINGAKWADKNPNSRTITEYLYKEKGYPISLNGDIPTYEEVVKHVQAYNNYKMRQKACDDIESTDAELNLKSLWHDVCEEPLLEETEIIFLNEQGFAYISERFGATFSYNLEDYSWQSYVNLLNIRKWAYISDLSPKGCKR